MEPLESLRKEVFRLTNKAEFDEVCLKVFKYQAVYCEVYKAYVELLGINPSEIVSINSIPFLPIEFFKTHQIVTGNKPVEKIFESSGTTGTNTSKHYVCDTSVYETSFLNSFNLFYGDVKQWCILGLLPSYLEKGNSSLVFMVDGLIKQSANPLSGFHLYDTNRLSEKLKILLGGGQKIWLIGVTYALLDLAEQLEFPLTNTVLLETGGMKGRRKEMVKEEIHDILRKKFSLKSIHSEYGMTEMLSQAYSKGDGIFVPSPWMKVLIRDTNDPFNILNANKAGGINVIDLANLYSCSFISTQDLGKVNEDGSFEVLGRFDNSDIRGCNLLIG